MVALPLNTTVAPPPPPSTIRGGIPDYIGQTNSLVDLLSATAHDPQGYDWEDDSDADEDSSDELSGDDSTLTTPSDSTTNLPPSDVLHDPHIFLSPKSTPSSSIIESPIPSADPHNLNLVRGKSLLLQKEYAALNSDVLELALDGFDSVDDAVLRAQVGEDGVTAAGDETFEDPKVVDGDKSPKKRLETLTNEFGKWSDDSEVFVESVPGALYRGVLVKGLLALTNRRFFIYAFIPRAEENKVIRAGPVTIHFPGTLTRKHRVWVELKNDSTSWYRSSTKTYKPLGSCRLSQLKEILPYVSVFSGFASRLRQFRSSRLTTLRESQNPEEPNSVRIELIDGRARRFELDTEESAVAWRSDMEAAVFTFRATADKLRLSLPLQLIQRIVTEPYMNLAERVQIHFDSGRCAEGSEGEESDDSASLGEEGTRTNGNREGKKARTPSTIEFGYLKNHHTFVESLQKFVDLAQELPSCGGVQPILELDSEVRTADAEAQKELSTDKTLAAQFVRQFALHDKPTDLFVAPSCELVRNLPTWGSLVISSRFLCFWRKGVLSSDVKLRIPLTDIDDVGPSKAWGFRIVGLAIQVHGAPDVRLDFKSKTLRDLVITTLKSSIALAGSTSAPPLSHSLSSTSSVSSAISNSQYIISPVRTSFQASLDRQVVLGQPMEENVSIPAGLAASQMPKVLGTVGTKQITGLHFVCLTIGSRGDVQPYIALGRELMKDGNRVTIASHPEYREWVESFGISYKEVGGDPAALMKFAESWAACQEADILIESPSTFAGIHVAEALGIPYFRAFTMPWTSTATYPQAFAASVDLGPTYNLLSYSIFDNVIWKAMSGQINRWRKNMLKIPPTSLHKMSQAKTPFIYNFSSAVCPKPNDWRDFIHISGYWFLDDERPWTAPEGMMEFIAKAREDGKAVIYIGFGSIVVPDSTAVTKAVVNAVLDSDVRAILSKGWSDRGTTPTEEVVLPPEIFQVASVPHDRLFPLIDAACHHGGAGTVGASLRAGLPTLIHPFFGDQFFWSSRVQKLGAGLKITSLTEKDLSAAFKQGTTDRIMKEKAAAVGERIRSENGPRVALSFINSCSGRTSGEVGTSGEQAHGGLSYWSHTFPDILETSIPLNHTNSVNNPNPVNDTSRFRKADSWTVEDEHGDEAQYDVGALSL
ncbi:hypothetical protein P7C70_g1228, partial [Phenoliferia sp. Uapishka_3]